MGLDLQGNKFVPLLGRGILEPNSDVADAHIVESTLV